VLWVHDILDVTPVPWQETSGARRRNSWRRRVFIDRETVERTAERGRLTDEQRRSAVEASLGLNGDRGPNLSSMSARISPQDGQRTGKGCVPRERWARGVPCRAQCPQLSAHAPGIILGEALVWRYYSPKEMGERRTTVHGRSASIIALQRRAEWKWRGVR
jgi:hypothetical protein